MFSRDLNNHQVDQQILTVAAVNAICSWIGITSYSVAVNIESTVAAILFLGAIYIPVGLVLTLILGVIDIQFWISGRRGLLAAKTTMYNVIAVLAYLVWLSLLRWLPPLSA